MFKCMPFSRCSRHVEAIDKRHQNLTSFPDDIIRYYRTLEELFLNSNQLHELPKGFYKLTQLRKLDISDNEIERISHEIGNFVNLVEFDCNRNDIQEFPDSIRYLRNLQVLDISNNPLQSLPNGLTQLKALTELTLNDLSLPYLPEDIGGLVNLRSLQARDNLLKSIPDSLCTIPKLESLDLGSNEIEEIPNNIGKLANLKVLWLDLNQIKSVPSEIGRLKKLQYLELSENMLETLPDEIAGCIGLTDINLAQNSIEYIPSTVGQLANLSILKLEQNQLVVLTPQIGQCTQLSELVLTENLLSEVPASLGNLKVLTNFNVDRNRLTYLPDEICECENLGLLFVRDNQLSRLPEQLGKLQKLRVLDVAGNRLAYLPASLAQANLNAIWLAENQATGKIKLQPDFDEETQKEVLTCYLLPQQNFHTPSMENLLQGSINTNTENASQGGFLQQQQAGETPSMRQATSESVRFAPESDNEEKPSHFVRTNTPHPKELAKKKEALKQRNVTVSNTTSTVTANGITTTMVSSSKVQFEHMGTNDNDEQLAPQQLPVINTKLLNASNNDEPQVVDESIRTNNKTSTSPRMNQIKFPPSKQKEVSRESQKAEIQDRDEQNAETECDSDQQRNSSNGHYKHVDFKINDIKTIPNEDEQEENEEEDQVGAENNDESANTSSSNHCRLRRRDTPHHLKGARINATTNPAQQLDPLEMKEILERYQSSNQTSPKSVPISPANGHQQHQQKFTNGNSTQSLNNKEKPASIYVPENLKYDDLRKQIQLVIHVNREEGAGLGVRIAGGKGSLNPYKDDDDGIFITRILPDSPALKTGLKVGDKLLKVNQACLDDLTHQEAADALREAVKLGTQLTLSVLQDLDMNKLYFLKIPALNEQGMSEYMEKHSTTSGFKINYNFNTIQQREVEIIFVGDHKRFAQLRKSDILLQINGKNIDDMSEKDLNKFVANSSNPKASNEFHINYLTIYRPYIQEEQLSAQSELIDDCCEHDRDGHHNNRNSNGNDSQNNPNDEHDEHNDSSKSNNSFSHSQNPNTTNGLNNHQSAISATTTTTTTPIVQGETQAKRVVNGLIEQQQQQQTPKLLNNPISSSTPMRNKQSSEIESNQNGSNGNVHLEEEENESMQKIADEKQVETSDLYPIEEIFIKKANGAMGLSIVGGGNFACHPFGVDRPGIFISKIVAQGPASNTNLRVGDRLLKVNGVDVSNMTHDETVEELKQNSQQVILLVSHDPQPAGMQEVILNRSFPEETLGIRINGGIENKSANPYDSTDEGIFVVNLIQGTLAHRDGRLRVGTRIMEVNGHSLLGVKLSEAQSYLIKASDIVHMVICDGFQAPNVDTSNSSTVDSGITNKAAPFPRPPQNGAVPPQPAARTFYSSSSLNGSKTKPEVPEKPNKLNLINTSVTTTQSNYDNLRSIDDLSDQSQVASPVITKDSDVPDKVATNGKPLPVQPRTILPTNLSNENPTTNELVKTNGVSNGSSNGVTNGNHTTTNGNGVNKTAVNTSLPITDKSLMNNIMNRANMSLNNDPKSQSMFTPTTGTNGNLTGNKLIQQQSDSVRSFKDKMNFFESCKDLQKQKEQQEKPRTKFSYLQEHEIQKLKQEEEKKISLLSQDEIMSMSRLECEDITNHKDYVAFFSN